MRFSCLATPVALVDGPILERNVASASRFAQHLGIALRPHVKTHKCAEIARLQMSAGAAGITCATVDEAAAFAEAGIRDIFIAYPIVGEAKIELLKRFCGIAKVVVAADNEEHIVLLESAAPALESKLFVRIEIDSGHHRCGLPPGPDVVRLARRISASPALVLDG
ncbi:MAG TPA: alanine racemase, partial [Candidatus Ozemobacteraceae bacterium]|nr:alanine racemase [Candidatus Ozemobacteraceae bacterium]